MTTFIKKKLKDREGNYLVTPSSADIVYCSDGETVATKLRKVENDEFSPTITQMSTVSKVGVGEDIDISDNIQEGYLKSAILSGQTLVNVLDYSRWGEQEKITFVADGTAKSIGLGMDLPIKTNTKYLTIIPVYENTINNNLTIGGWDYYTDQPTITAADGTGIIKMIKTTRDVFLGGYLYLELWQENTSGQITFGKPMIIEYQEGMENWDIPYFTGMQSVKLPVLATFTENGNLSPNNEWFYEQGTINGATGLLEENPLRIRTKNFIPFDGEKVIIENTGNLAIRCYDEKKTLIYNGTFAGFLQKNIVYSVPTGTKYIKLVYAKTDYNLPITPSEIANLNTYVSKGTALIKEPFKSNILTVNEEVKLRGIGEVKDELNCLTGELTERIGEIVLDGSFSFTKTTVLPSGADATIYSRFYINNIPSYNSGRLIAENFLVEDYNYIGERLETGSNGRAGIMLLKSKLQSDDVNGLVSYLNDNPITVQYELDESTVKTVDLKPLGTNPTTQPYVWKDGHIQLSSEEGSLLPTLDYSVTTSRGGQILENTKHIAKQDKRIYDLEMLMINSSVEDAYQRLLLQNDVQVMSRMDETHLNPMRYYMLTRLIEEKMYEETDMLNKLDTFFLYGDISSDQYFELMDKIFGMEEIIEEDFTEEK